MEEVTISKDKLIEVLKSEFRVGDIIIYDDSIKFILEKLGFKDCDNGKN